MTEISSFFAITIRMPRCENSPPHFHAHYQGFEVTVDIANGITNGRFPPRATALVQEWLQMRRPELMEDWNIVMQNGTLKPIEPLL